MNELLTKANLLIRKNRPPDDPSQCITTFWQNKFLQLTFHTIGCRYSAMGSCSMCNYGTGNECSSQAILRELEKICHSEIFMQSDMILLGASGSFLDDCEIPEPLQLDIMQYISRCHIQEIHIETHYQSITEEKLKKIQEIFSNKKIYIEMGLETITEAYQKDILNKIIPAKEIKKTISHIHAHQMYVSLNILLGMPFLSAKQQLEDTKATICWATENKADYIVIFPINIQPYTLFEWWHNHGFISDVSPWLLFILLFSLSENELKHVCLAWYGNRSIVYSNGKKTITPYSCPECQPELLDFFKDFSARFDADYRKKILQKFFQKTFSCHCRQDIWNKIEIDKNENPYSKIKTAYEAIQRRIDHDEFR